VSDQQLFEIVLDSASAEALQSNRIDIVDVLLHENRDLKRVPKTALPGTRDAASIISATATLAPMVVPIVTVLIRRLLPRVEITTRTINNNGVITTEIHTKES
jgi:hypothetical protein